MSSWKSNLCSQTFLTLLSKHSVEKFRSKFTSRTIVLIRELKAPSARIRIFLNPQLFLSGFKNFPVHTHAMVSGFTLVPKAPLHQNVFTACAVERDSGGKFAMFERHGVPPYCFIVRRETGHAFYVIRFEISGFNRPHVIGFVADLFFSTLESGFIFFRIRCRIHRMRVDGSRSRKEKVADSKISGYVWTGP